MVKFTIYDRLEEKTYEVKSLYYRNGNLSQRVDIYFDREYDKGGWYTPIVKRIDMGTRLKNKELEWPDRIRYVLKVRGIEAE